MKKYNAFTLAEIMIVLTVVGVLSAILLPIAFHANPDEEIMKFKKGNETLGMVIRELVTSDKYYMDGDLGVKANNSIIHNDYDYFCQTFADILATKSVNCNETAGYTGVSGNTSVVYSATGNTQNAYSNLENMKKGLDEACNSATGIAPGAEIVTPDGITYYQTAPKVPFGAVSTPSGTPSKNARYFGGNNSYYRDKDGFDRVYKVICFDVDGLGTGQNAFGYGVRADGKIIPGERADEWIKKGFQEDN